MYWHHLQREQTCPIKTGVSILWINWVSSRADDLIITLDCSTLATTRGNGSNWNGPDCILPPWHGVAILGESKLCFYQFPKMERVHNKYAGGSHHARTGLALLIIYSAWNPIQIARDKRSFNDKLRDNRANVLGTNRSAVIWWRYLRVSIFPLLLLLAVEINELTRIGSLGCQWLEWDTFFILLAGPAWIVHLGVVFCCRHFACVSIQLALATRKWKLSFGMVKY